ncbi:GDSL-type esterase/lipase family protein [Streptomyces sp. NPDC059850]|uniref:GDSL-type esterase/lipase family protein n=1 Tax=Streptomyces sp. NPDC059850 TaxID=3346970 RepID=UPI0036698955
MTAHGKTRQRALIACAALAAGALALTACDGGGTNDTGSAAPKIVISAKDGAKGASVDTTGVKANHGKLTKVTMTVAGSGSAVPGALSANSTRWNPKERLKPRTTYRISARGRGSGGEALTADSVFTTSGKAGAGLEYVAMGSSFAAGPGIPPGQPGGGATACGRSVNNYPSIVARDTGAHLTDVTCSGATTANILNRGQSGQPPQIDAVTSTTRLVTITIGGNDVNYLGSLGAYSCQTGGGTNCGTVDQSAIDQTFGLLTDRLKNVVNAVHGIAPDADIYLVNYFTLLPDAGTCAGAPLTTDQAAFERGVASRLANATASAAEGTGATLIDLAAASRSHDACSPDPWVEAYRPAAGRVAYHPNENGMRAAARLVKSALKAPE